MARLVAYGDDIAAGLAQVTPTAVNLGRSGAGLAAGLMPPTTGIIPGDCVIVSTGFNDLNAVFKAHPTFSSALYEKKLSLLLNEIRLRNKTGLCILLGLEPLNTRFYAGLNNGQVLQMNHLLSRVANQQGALFCDLALHPVTHRSEDGIFYTPQGYQNLMGRAANLTSSTGVAIQRRVFSAPLFPQLAH